MILSHEISLFNTEDVFDSSCKLAFHNIDGNCVQCILKDLYNHTVKKLLAPQAVSL